MVDLILKIINALLNLFGAGKPDPVSQGEQMGKAEVERDSAVQSLKDTDAAQGAADAERSSLEHDPQRVRQSDDAERPIDLSGEQ